MAMLTVQTSSINLTLKVELHNWNTYYINTKVTIDDSRLYASIQIVQVAST